jgi:NTP pyrophosphatase (non-canonical NTP hydrolase)
MVRPEIRAFAEALEAIAQLNELRGKGDSWKTVDERRLVEALLSEVMEFGDAKNEGDAVDEAADIGLYSYFLWWRHGGSNEVHE